MFLVGGSSRIPLVARLVHERTGVMPTTLDQPETVVARGALRAVSTGPAAYRWPAAAAADGRGRRQTPTRATLPPVTQGFPPAGRPPVPGQFPQRPTPAAPVSTIPAPATKAPGRGRRRMLVGVLAVVLVGAAAAGFLLYGNQGDATQQTTVATPPGEQLISQYDYKFNTPQGWSESASNAPDLEVQITPTAAPTGGDAIYVREYRLSYDSTKDRQRAVDELRPAVASAGYLNFKSSLTFANRTVAYYQQPGNDATADWYVLFQGRVQVSVGCQYPTVDEATVTKACEQVVGGLAIAG